MAFPKFDSKTFRNAALGLTGAVAAAAMVVGPSAAEDRKEEPAPSFLTAEIEHIANADEYPEMGPLEAIEFSRGQVVLYAGRDLKNLGAVEEYLNGAGRPATIVYFNGEEGPLRVEDDQFAVFANGQFGGIYGQYAINYGLAADIELFAKNNGVPLQLPDTAPEPLNNGLH